MQSIRPTTRYDGPSIAMHWVMLLLMAAVYACIELREFYPKGSDIRDGLKSLHFMLGLAILFMVALRLLLRLGRPAPPISPTPPVWQALASRLVHLGLYVFMIAMPFAGWLMLSAAGKPVPFFGLELPPLIGLDKPLAHRIKEMHETFGSVGYYLIGFHALAALFHHYVMRDDTLRRMLPGRA